MKGNLLHNKICIEEVYFLCKIPFGNVRTHQETESVSEEIICREKMTGNHVTLRPSNNRYSAQYNILKCQNLNF